MTFTVAGVDLSAEPPRTAVAILESGNQWRVINLVLGATNADIVEISGGASKIGIDCPLGWPVDFVEFVATHSAAASLVRSPEMDLAWRQRLTFRETDRDVLARTGQRPLSVAANLLGLVALRCAVLLDDLAARGRDIRRDGLGGVVEVYPAAALRIWNLPTRSYKTDKAARSLLVEELKFAAPFLDLGDHETLCRDSADAFDAVIASLVAMASALESCAPIPAEYADVAKREGWIAVPPALSELRT